MVLIGILQVSSVIGLVISFYFYGVYKGFVTDSLVPRRLCARNTCHDVLKTPFAHVFKVPNFSLGIFYYVLIFFSTLINPVPATMTLLLVLSWVVVVFSAYLVYALLFELRMNCVLCYIAQIVNVIIAVSVYLLY
jgi:uncharacterized membrane protein